MKQRPRIRYRNARSGRIRVSVSERNIRMRMHQNIVFRGMEILSGVACAACAVKTMRPAKFIVEGEALCVDHAFEKSSI